MKSILLFSSFMLLCLFGQAKIWRVNNNSGITADFTYPQAAHDAASAGDTIHIETSTILYSGLTATKPLTWIGNGYFQDASKASTLDWINFYSGSANSLFLGINTGNSVTIATNNITISRCLIPYLYFDAFSANKSHDFVMNQSFVSNGVQFLTSYYGSIYPSSNYTFTNCIILNSLYLPANFTNIVLSQNFIQAINSATISTVVNNNILYNTPQSICTYASNVYNNLFMGSTNSFYVGTNGNITVSGNPTITNTVFTNTLTTSYDNWAVLKAGSPAIGAGLGGSDIGPFGGVNKYKLGGIPPIPTFSQFQIQSTPVNSLPVIISTRSNN